MSKCMAIGCPGSATSDRLACEEHDLLLAKFARAFGVDPTIWRVLLQHARERVARIEIVLAELRENTMTDDEIEGLLQ